MRHNLQHSQTTPQHHNNSVAISAQGKRGASPPPVCFKQYRCHLVQAHLGGVPVSPIARSALPLPRAIYGSRSSQTTTVQGCKMPKYSKYAIPTMGCAPVGACSNTSNPPWKSGRQYQQKPTTWKCAGKGGCGHSWNKMEQCICKCGLNWDWAKRPGAAMAATSGATAPAAAKPQGAKSAATATEGTKGGTTTPSAHQ